MAELTIKNNLFQYSNYGTTQLILKDKFLEGAPDLLFDWALKWACYFGQFSGKFLSDLHHLK